MSGRHTGRTGQGVRITALPRTLKLLFRLAPRQLNDEIAYAKAEIKRKGVQVGVAAAFFAVALVFLSFLLVGLIVAAIMGLATIMPAWLAALLVCAAFLVIALTGALIGLRKFKKAMPLMPAEAIRGIRHDLGIAKEGSGFNAAVLDPSSPEAKAAKAAKEEAAAKDAAEKKAKAEAHRQEFPEASGPELHRRLEQRRHHIAQARDELDAELDLKPQIRFLAGSAKEQAEKVRKSLAGTLAGFPTSPAGSDVRWRPLAAFAASAAVLVVLLRRLLRNP